MSSANYSDEVRLRVAAQLLTALLRISCKPIDDSFDDDQLVDYKIEFSGLACELVELAVCAADILIREIDRT